MNNLHVTKHLCFYWEMSLPSLLSIFIRPPFPPMYTNSIHPWWSLLLVTQRRSLSQWERGLGLELDTCVFESPICDLLPGWPDLLECWYHKPQYVMGGLENKMHVRHSVQSLAWRNPLYWRGGIVEPTNTTKWLVMIPY